MTVARLDMSLRPNEVFECDDPEGLVKRGDAFFSMLPAPDVRAPLASASPLDSAAHDRKDTERER